MLRKKLVLTAAPAALALSLALSAAAAQRVEETPASTPPDLMLVDVTKFIGNASNQFMWRHIATREGKPLYTFNDDANAGGKPTCVDACAKEFIPYAAPAGAVAVADWSIVTRPDGTKQWAYQNLPLYVYSGKDPRGEPAQGGLSTTGAESPDNFDPGSKLYSPKQGWKRAAYDPTKTIPMPAGIELTSIASANGYAFVNSSTKMVTYTLKTPPKSDAWQPVYAPTLALPVGDFTVLRREDGTSQWAYKGKGLYNYTGDYAPDDITGITEKGAEVALALKHFTPKEVGVQVIPGRGPLLVTAKGNMSIYTISRQHLQYGGRQVRGGYRYSYMDAKAVGTKGCDANTECSRMYKPVLAPADAKSWGFWEVMTRADGKKQWAYRGSALYTYAEDKKPGDILGNNRHVIVFGDPEGKIDISVTGGDDINGKYDAGAGLYWHLVGLHY